MSNYYYLVAGLADISFDDDRLNYSVDSFKEEIYPSLTDTDKRLIDLVFYQDDNKRLLSLLKNEADPAAVNEGLDSSSEKTGKFSDEELQELISAVRKGNFDVSNICPHYMYQFVTEYLDGDSESESIFHEDRLSNLFFEYALKADNKFVRDWFRFTKDLSNLQAAITARKYSLTTSEYIVGEDEVSEALKNSGSRDWGLSSALDFFDEVMQIEDEDNLSLREKRIDVLKWNWLDNHSFFDYFTIERLFSFLIKLEIVGRWIKLDEVKGQQLFRSLIDKLKRGVEIPIESENK